MMAANEPTPSDTDIDEVKPVFVVEGSMPSPSPQGLDRHTPPESERAMALISRIEAELQTIHSALAEIKQLQGKAG